LNPEENPFVAQKRSLLNPRAKPFISQQRSRLNPKAKPFINQKHSDSVGSSGVRDSITGWAQQQSQNYLSGDHGSTLGWTQLQPQ
jgi:hypothetical protein